MLITLNVRLRPVVIPHTHARAGCYAIMAGVHIYIYVYICLWTKKNVIVL